jgi:hypothetical protein
MSITGVQPLPLNPVIKILYEDHRKLVSCGQCQYGNKASRELFYQIMMEHSVLQLQSEEMAVVVGAPYLMN